MTTLVQVCGTTSVLCALRFGRLVIDDYQRTRQITDARRIVVSKIFPNATTFQVPSRGKISLDYKAPAFHRKVHEWLEAYQQDNTNQRDYSPITLQATLP